MFLLQYIYWSFNLLKKIRIKHWSLRSLKLVVVNIEFLAFDHVHRRKKFGLLEGHVVFEEVKITTRSYVWKINFISFGCFFLLNLQHAKEVWIVDRLIVLEISSKFWIFFVSITNVQRVYLNKRELNLFPTFGNGFVCPFCHCP